MLVKTTETFWRNKGWGCDIIIEKDFVYSGCPPEWFVFAYCAGNKTEIKSFANQSEAYDFAQRLADLINSTEKGKHS